MKKIFTALCISALSLSAFADRTIECRSTADSSLIATLNLSDMYGSEIMGTLEVGGSEINLSAVGNSDDILNNNELKRNQLILGLMQRGSLSAENKINLKYSHSATSQAITVSDVLAEISDDGAGVIFLESSKDSKMNGGILFAGWAGEFTNCAEKK